MCWPDERASAAQADPADPHGTGRPAAPRLRRHTGLGGDLAALNSEVQAGLTGEPVTAALITASFRSPEAASALQRFRGDRYARCAVVVERGVARGASALRGRAREGCSSPPRHRSISKSCSCGATIPSSRDRRHGARRWPRRAGSSSAGGRGSAQHADEDGFLPPGRLTKASARQPSRQRHVRAGQSVDRTQDEPHGGHDRSPDPPEQSRLHGQLRSVRSRIPPVRPGTATGTSTRPTTLLRTAVPTQHHAPILPGNCRQGRHRRLCRCARTRG
ncbi:TetR-like C-terminal domain-containing protein [Streptomyces sp. T12]|uniref:TetR-like C-terminal domain-containing protein n=1 Tax=Streptomyces sp. T12 TaxID=477697 RepID=UPI0021BD8CBC|nr:TetR-like C-terminal domain-containing protein [Streptomyces sp. T12]